MRILVVGAGAVGGYFGARLIEAKRDVTFLVRPKRAAQLSAEGLQIVSQYGDLNLRPKSTTAEHIEGPYDVIFLSVKSYSLAAAMNDMAAAVGPETMIFPALNGMRHIDLLTGRFPGGNVLGGVCFVTTDLDERGRIVQLSGLQGLRYGELDGKSTERVAKLDDAFNGAGFSAGISSHILAEMWQKWVQLATLGALTCLLRADVGQIASTTGGPEIALSALHECTAIASACGYPASEGFLDQMTRQLTDKGSRLTASMYRDMMRGAPVEADTILGDFVDRGHQQHMVSPILQAAFVTLSIYQRNLARPGSESQPVS